MIAQIGELHQKGEELRQRIAELTQNTAEHILSDREFDLLRELLSSFQDTIDGMSVEQKRAAIHTCVRKVVWDGENIHIYLFGAEGDWEFPNCSRPGGADSEPLGENNK